MPYKHSEHTGEALLAQATACPPFGPGFTPELAAQADRMEVWCSSFEDAGDWCRFDLYAAGVVIASARMRGH